VRRWQAPRFEQKSPFLSFEFRRTYNIIPQPRLKRNHAPFGTALGLVLGITLIAEVGVHVE
jgi:hypothetical protein